jgi:hypothetical protein
LQSAWGETLSRQRKLALAHLDEASALPRELVSGKNGTVAAATKDRVEVVAACRARRTIRFIAGTITAARIAARSISAGSIAGGCVAGGCVAGGCVAGSAVWRACGKRRSARRREGEHRCERTKEKAIPSDHPSRFSLHPSGELGPLKKSIGITERVHG